MKQLVYLLVPQVVEVDMHTPNHFRMPDRALWEESLRTAFKSHVVKPLP